MTYAEILIKKGKRGAAAFIQAECISNKGHPLTWIQRKSHRFGQGAHDCGCKSEQDPAELVLRFKTWALYSVRCPCPNL